VSFWNAPCGFALRSGSMACAARPLAPDPLIAVAQYAHGVLMIRFLGSHEDYDKVDAETV
jgi:hypothetical protein